MVNAVKKVSEESDSPSTSIVLGLYIKEAALLKASIGADLDNEEGELLRKREAFYGQVRRPLAVVLSIALLHYLDLPFIQVLFLLF